jgi:two-component system, sensor histidine kinase LadS
MRIIFAISCWLIIFSAFSQSNNKLQVEAGYLIDSNSVLRTVDPGLAKFYPLHEHQVLNAGYNNNAAVWCFFRIKNNSPTKEKVLLCFHNNHLDSIQLFDSAEVKLLGDRTSNNSGYLTCQAFEAEVGPSAQKILVARIKKVNSFLDFSFSLENEEDLLHDSRKNVFLISFLLGIIFLLILVNSILWIVSKKKLYALYICYTLFSAGYVMISSGFAKFVLLPGFLYFSELRIYCSILWFIALGAFLIEFLELSKHSNKHFKLIRFLNLVNFFFVCITIPMVITNNFFLVKYIFGFTYINFLAVIVLIIWAAIRHLKIDKWNGVYVLIAFLPAFIWSVVFILNAFNLVSGANNADAVVYVSLFEIMWFGFVLGRNYIKVYQNNNKLNLRILKEKEISIKAITNAQIRERSHIANLIHDQFGSKLTHVLHLLELKKINLADQNVREITMEIRGISHQIMPRALEEGALFSSIKDHIAQINKGLENCSVEIEGFDFPAKIEHQLALNIYLISIELISNAIKHGEPKNVGVEFYSYDDSFVFQFMDDGCGYNLKSTTRGFGLNTIESRVTGMNGTFEVNSAPGEGTVVQIVIPK